jgi:parvulin-like peptidyl-prolyl isomerase
MKKTLGLMAVLMTALASVVSAQDVVDKPVAIVKLYETEVISSKKFIRVVEFFETQSGKKMTKEEKKVLLDNMVYEVLILQAAKHDGISITEEKITKMAINQIMAQYGVQITEDQLREMMEKQGINYNQYIEIMKKQIIVDTYIRTKKKTKFDSVTPPTELEIKTFYDNNSFQFINPEMLSFSHIFYDTSAAASPEERKKIQAKAEDTYKKIKAGASFEETMKSEPVMPNNYNIQNGNLGYVPRGSQELIFVFGEDFSNKLFELKTGSIALLQSKQGYHIVKITDYREKKFLNLNDPINPMESSTVKQYISQLLMSNKQKAIYQVAYNELIKELTDKAEIKVFQDNF